MANNLYEEAINAAEQLKEAAESKVKQHLIEAMSPQIKQLVEKSLLYLLPRRQYHPTLISIERCIWHTHSSHRRKRRINFYIHS